MITFKPTPYAALKPQREAYLTTTPVPLDGMWEDAFFANGQHMMIEAEGQTIGYLGLNEDNALLGVQVFDPALARAAFRAGLAKLDLKRAFVSTAEPAYLSLCLDHHSAVTVNALMYEATGPHEAAIEAAPNDLYRLVSMADFEAAIAFGLRAIGADRAWLEGYYAERIDKAELFGLWRGDALIGAGELRISPSQPGVADVGMVVAPEARRQGLATNILRRLRADGLKRGYRVICSTEADNLGAQKAIERAGFHAHHRILEVSLKRAD